jgi:hypothetical protein
VGAGVAILMAAALSCARYARFQGLAAQTGTCEGACRHYLGCKDDQSSKALRGCMADCSDIFVYQGEPDRDSLRMFESLECSAAVAFVEGEEDGHSRTAKSPRAAPGRSRAH